MVTRGCPAHSTSDFSALAVTKSGCGLDTWGKFSLNASLSARRSACRLQAGESGRQGAVDWRQTGAGTRGPAAGTMTGTRASQPGNGPLADGRWTSGQRRGTKSAAVRARPASSTARCSLKMSSVSWSCADSEISDSAERES